MLIARRPHFLVAFHPNVCSERLKVPVKFSKHLEGKTFGSVLLIGPSGNTWNVNLSKHNDEFVLDDGWPTFVKDHSIQCGDSLVFRYDGDMHFSVQIFDQSSCEKEEAFYAKHSDARLVTRKRERETELVSSSEAYLGIQKKTRSIYSSDYLNCETASRELKMDKCRDENRHSVKVSEDGQDQFLCSGIKEKISMASRKAIAMAMSSDGSVQRKKRVHQGKPKVTMKKKSSISSFIEQRATQYFVSQFPYFVRVMKSSNVSSSGTLKIPVQFSMEHLPNCRTKVILQNLQGDSWTLSSVPTVRLHTMHTLCGGWTGFVRDNDIKMEDLCIFELVGDCEMRVRILRLGLEGLDYEGLKGGISGCAVASAQFSSKKDESTPRNSKGKHPNNDLNHRKREEICWKPESRDLEALSIHARRDADPSNLNSYASSETWSQRKDGAWAYNNGSLSNQTGKRDLLDSSGRGITAVLSTNGASAPESFTSPFPNFMKVMRISNISGPYTMNIPSKFATAHFPCCRTEIVLRNVKGECWTVNSYPSSSRCTAHTLCGGWMSFVRGNDIKLGDICVFELVGKGELQVHIFKNRRRDMESCNSNTHADESTVDVDSTGGADLSDT